MTMMKVYRGTDGDNEPVEMECEKFGWPNYTMCGEQMFDNTHFMTRDAAWESILDSANAGMELAGRSVYNALIVLQIVLQKATIENNESIKRWSDVFKRYRKYLQSKKG